MLILVIAGAALWALMMLIGAVVAGPAGLVVLGVLAFAGYILWRLVSERTKNAEDTYYEDKFDR